MIPTSCFTSTGALGFSAKAVTILGNTGESAEKARPTGTDENTRAPLSAHPAGATPSLTDISTPSAILSADPNTPLQPPGSTKQICLIPPSGYLENHVSPA